MINFLRTLATELLCLVLRFLPIPVKTGLVRIGHPGRNSPVLVTGNYLLTVSRLRRALKGTDAYLLVANSHGINVWCAAGGGHLTHHQVISQLKVTGIEQLVDHRTLILPQLAATGVDGRQIRKSTGWRTVWGPVYARQLPAFLADIKQKPSRFREVRFPLHQRLEMAAVWALPTALVLYGILSWLWPAAAPAGAAVCLLLALTLFAAYPLYEPLMRPARRLFRSMPFAAGGLQQILILLATAVLVAVFFMVPGVSPLHLLRWELLLIVIIGVLTLDLPGSTPITKSWTHADRVWHISLFPERCKRAGDCVAVCPRNCLELPPELGPVLIARPERCIRCGACVVQCPFDALYFLNEKGEAILPGTVRTHKLNLWGQRAVRIQSDEP